MGTLQRVKIEDWRVDKIGALHCIGALDSDTIDPQCIKYLPTGCIVYVVQLGYTECERAEEGL